MAVPDRSSGGLEVAVSIRCGGEVDLRPLFEHVEQMGDLLRPLMRQPLLAEVMESFRASLVVAFREHLGAGGDTPSLRADFLAGAVVAGVRAHLDQPGMSPSRRPPGEAASEVTTYVRAVLAGGP